MNHFGALSVKIWPSKGLEMGLYHVEKGCDGKSRLIGKLFLSPSHWDKQRLKRRSLAPSSGAVQVPCICMQCCCGF